MNKFHSNEFKSELEVSQIVDTYLSRFDISKPIFLLRDKEAGYDLNLVENILWSKNISVINVTPKDLTIHNNELKAHGMDCEQRHIKLAIDRFLRNYLVF